ncbi:hypothetical protein MJH12_13620, partial [bacterium]|nr:hypothetical protein [bacterium]
SSVFKDKILVSGGVSNGSHNDTLEVLEKVPSVVNSNLLFRHHPSFGVASLTQKREGHSSNIYNDLYFVIGGKGTKWPSTLIEAYKLSSNNIQTGIVSASDTAQVTFTLKQLVPQTALTKPVVFDLSGDVDSDNNTVYSGDLQIVFDMSMINQEAQTAPFSTEVYLEYSEDSGLTWLEAKPITKSTSGEELTSMTIGSNKEIIWDSTVLFPGNYQNIIVRVKTINGSVSEKSDPFDILNSPEYAKSLPIITNLVITGSEPDGKLHLSYTITDGNNENSSIEIFFFNGDEEEEIETITDISPGNKTYTWNSRDNLQSFLANTYIRMLPSDGKTLEEGLGDTTEQFDCPNGGIAAGDISVSATCNTLAMTSSDDIYICGADNSGSTAIWTLDASSTVSENNGAPLSYTWELLENINTVALTNADQAIATLTINDPGEVTSSNKERKPLVKVTITEASNSYISFDETLNFTLQKPEVIASALITSYQCPNDVNNSVIALNSTSMSAGCTQLPGTMIVQLDGNASINPNSSGLT